jgi:hypothetical protein
MNEYQRAEKQKANFGLFVFAGVLKGNIYIYVNSK